MKKYASKMKEIFPQAYGLLQRGGESPLSLPRLKLPPIDKIFLDDSAPPDAQDAIAYVTNKDADGNGRVDAIHIVLPKFIAQLKQSGVDIDQLSSSDFTNIKSSAKLQIVSGLMSALVEVLAHELGHLEGGSEFKGEPEAEAAARSATQNIRISSNGVIMLNKLKKIANMLDQKGQYKIADELDSVIEKIAVVQSAEYSPEWMKYIQRSNNLPSARGLAQVWKHLAPKFGKTEAYGDFVQWYKGMKQELGRDFHPDEAMQYVADSALLYQFMNSRMVDDAVLQKLKAPSKADFYERYMNLMRTNDTAGLKVYRDAMKRQLGLTV